MTSKTKQNTITLLEKEEVLQMIELGKGYSEIASIFKIGKSTIGDIFKKRHQIRLMLAGRPELLQRKTLKRGNFPELEDELLLWYAEQQKANCQVSNEMFKSEAKRIHIKLKGENAIFQLGVGWLSRFKKRYGIPSTMKRNNFTRQDINNKVVKIEISEQLNIEEIQEEEVQEEEVEIEMQEVVYYDDLVNEDLQDTDKIDSSSTALDKMNDVIAFCYANNYSYEDQNNLIKIRDKILLEVEGLEQVD